MTIQNGGDEFWSYENSWSVEVNLSGFVLGKYVVLASDIGDHTSSVVGFELIDDVEPPIGPTVPPTVKPTTAKTTIVPPIDTVSSLSLSQGWNFISVPKQLDAHNSSAAVLFGAVDTDNHAILSYDTAASDWNTLDGSNIVRPLEGIWIYSSSTAEIPLTYASGPMVPAVKRVYPGWNAVGLSARGNTLAANAIAGTSWSTLIPWNLQNSAWGDAIVNGGIGANSAYQYMTVGNGYWLYVSDAGVLTGLTG